MKTFLLFIFCSCLEVLTACNSYEPRHETSRPYHEAPRYAGQSGSVSHIDIISQEAHTSGGGAILGAVLGGVVGHQFGGGTGRTLATGAGAIGGAIAGNNIERSNKRDDELYRITVELDNGRVQQFDYRDIGDMRVGDRVKVKDGQILRL